MMGYLAKFGYDEIYFSNLLIKTIQNDPLLDNDPSLKEALCDLISHGGKRIRPLFLLMATDLGNHDNQRDGYLAAVGIELLHLSSLIHDDIIDNSSIRHGISTLHHRYGARTALRLGNYTLNKSLEVFSHFEDPRIHLQLAHTMKQLCLGELRQRDDFFNFDIQVEDYIQKSLQKTGTLISVSLVIGGIIAKLPDDKIQKLSNLGDYIGIAYQLKDDILDFTSLSSHLGKPVGNDLRQGVITLPTIFALEDSLLKQDLLSLHPNDESYIFDSLCTRIKEGHYIQKSEEVCQSYLNQTLAIINNLPKLKPKMSHLIQLLFN